MKIEKREWELLTPEMRRKRMAGYKFIVTYNDTNDFFTFKDKFYKKENMAVKFYEKLNCGMKKIQAL